MARWHSEQTRHTLGATRCNTKLPKMNARRMEGESMARWHSEHSMARRCSSGSSS